MKKLLVVCVFFHTLINTAQYNNIVASQMSSKFIEADEYVGEDAIGYQYFIKNNVLFKSKDSENFQYKNVQLGKITKIDLQNPLRILLFFENFNTLITLDNQLNEVQKLNLNEIDNNITLSAAGISGFNSYWIFNQNTQQLLLHNYLKNQTQAIGVVFEKPIKKYFSTYNYFFWIDLENDFYQCDIFGKKTLLAKFPEFDSISLNDEKIIPFQKEEKLYFFDIEKKKIIPVENIKKSFRSFYYKNQNLAIFTTEGITNYKINLP